MLGPRPQEPFDPTALRLGRDLRRVGSEPARAGWHRVRRGVWIPETEWSQLTPEQRHSALVHASDAVAREPGTRVYALASAAAVWGLPRIGRWPTYVTHLVTDHRTRCSDRVRPHVGAPAVAVERHGLRVTSVARTVVDLARTEPLPSAVAAADHALRHGWCTRADVLEEAAAVPRRVRGRPAASLVARLADPLSMSVGESLSRTQMFLLDLPRPRLQVPHADEDGLIGVVDFDWGGVVGEFDGRVKYRIPPDVDRRQAGRVLWQEKRREDRLRRRAAVARWVWDDALVRQRLARVLAPHGIRPQVRNSWFDLGG